MTDPDRPESCGRRGRGGTRWWCALPDLAVAGPAASALSALGQVTLRHRSGRAWIVTHPAAPAPEVVTRGSVSVAVLGTPRTDRAQLESPVRIAMTDGDVAPLMAAGGGAPVVLAEANRLRVVADAAGFHRVFTARCAAVPVVASHADILRQLVDAPLDRAWVAAKLASPEMPSAVRERRSPFTGVDPVPPGHVLELGGEQTRIIRWWRPPEPTATLAEGAEELRAALQGAVGGRVSSAAGRVSVALSGGLDSTALAWLAGSAHPLLVTTAGSSPVDDDLTCARRVASALPGAEHRVFGTEEIPGFFADLDSPIAAGMDEPCSFTAGAARQRYTAAVLAEAHVGVHLNGRGGDEVLLAPLGFLSGLPRTSWSAWRQVRGHAALHGIPARALVCALARRPSYAAWLRQAPVGLRRAVAVADDLIGWEASPLLPPWASRDAEQLAAGVLAHADPAPVHPDAGVHATLARIRASAYRAGLYRDAMVASGVPAAMPFFDHAVLCACLAVRPEQRTDPWQPKPLLRQALRTVVPAHLLERRTKGHYNHDIYRGWNDNRDQVRDLLAESRLTQLGLIDAEVLRRELTTFGSSGLPPAFVTDLIAVEVWLRDLAPALRAGARSCA